MKCMQILQQQQKQKYLFDKITFINDIMSRHSTMMIFYK